MEPQIAPVRNRSYQNQINILVSYMEEHTEFAKGHVTKLGPSGSDKFHEMWMELTQLLNASGPTSKHIDGWRRTWTHLRRTAKSKKAAYTVAMTKTGNCETTQPLSDLDVRINAIFGKYGTGLCVVREVGVRRKPNVEQLQIQLGEQPGMDVSSDDDIHWQSPESSIFHPYELSVQKCKTETMEIVVGFARSVMRCLRILTEVLLVDPEQEARHTISLDTEIIVQICMSAYSTP